MLEKSKETNEIDEIKLHLSEVVDPDKSKKTNEIDEIKLRLSEVIDPEIGINIVDLGLIRKVQLKEKQYVQLDATLTSVACPLTEYIESAIISSLEEYKIKINWVWDPPWSPSDISEEGKEYLYSLGIEI